MDGVAVGLRSGEGGSAAIALRLADGSPELVARVELVLVDDGGQKAPYHRAVDDPEHADALIDGAEATALARAAAALEGVRSEIDGVVTIGVVLGNNTPPSRERALRSHVLMHAAEGALYRRALLDAAQETGLPVFAVAERDVLSSLAARHDVTDQEATALLRRLGKAAGRPWRRPEQLASAVALLALGVEAT